MHYLTSLQSPAPTAETLLDEWEARARPTPSPDYTAKRAQLLQQLTPLCAVLVNHGSDVSVDEEDVRGASYFAGCFGITRPTDGQQPERIRLRFAPVQGRYALSFPLHSSQQLESETEEAIYLSLSVYDTHEMRMELLSYGSEVEVLEPAGLREWLREAHEAAASTT